MKTIIQIKTDWQGNQNDFRQSQWAHSTKDKQADNTQNKDLFHKKMYLQICPAGSASR